MKSNVFITGVTGCVGHYIFDQLAGNPDYQLYLLVRKPQRMKRDLSSYSNVTVIQGDLNNIQKHAELLKQIDYVVHVAAGWGQSELNYDYTISFFNLLDPNRCKKIIYFSTASILGPDNKLLKEAGEFGTSYIRGKYLCHQKLPQIKIHDRITTLFPTWVLGGDEEHPYSHATKGILSAVKWLWLIRFFTFDIGFHFIHARDIALIVDYLLRNDVAEREFVLGNSLTTAGKLIREICEHFHKKIYFQIEITPGFAKTVAAIFGKKLNEWDRYCLEKKRFEYRVVNAKAFGLRSEHETISDILKSLGRD